MLSTAPAILAVEVGSSDWTPAYLAQLNSAQLGTAGYRVGPASQPAPSQPATLAWRGVDRVHVRFDREVAVGIGDLELRGANVASYSFSQFFSDGNTATWTLAEPIAADNLFAVLSGDYLWEGNPFADSGPLFLRFSVLPGDANRDGLVSRADIAASVPEFADAMDAGYDPLYDVTGDGVVNLQDAVVIRDALGSTLPTTQPPGASTIVEISPADGEEMVSLTRETIVRFSAAVDPATVTPESLYVIANGGRLDGTIRVSATERFATFFYAGPLPASTEVRVVVDGEVIIGRDGLLLDADNDGQPGGRATADFRTLPITRIPGTRVWGYVYDSYNKTPEGADIPVVGATIRVDAFPEANVTTDATGHFELGLGDANGDGVADGLPAPEFFVHIDGTTAVNAPPGTIYPSVGKPFHSVPGQTVQLEMAGMPFNIYLPPMAMGDVVPLSATEDTPVHFGPEGMSTCAAILTEAGADPAACALMQVTYPAGSAIDEQGNVATQAIIIPVPPDRIPAPLPPGLDPKLVISIQAPGATNFDTPAPVTFPNLEGLAPGERAAVFSFNHDAGRWDVVGLGNVSIDGNSVLSNIGVGVVAPGWHFVGPPPKDPPPPPPPCSGPLSLCDPCGVTCWSEQIVEIIKVPIEHVICEEIAILLPGLGPIVCTIITIYHEVQILVEVQNCIAEWRLNPGSPTLSLAQEPAPAPTNSTTQIDARLAAIETLLYPFAVNRQVPPQSVIDDVETLLEEANALAGGDVLDYLRAVSLELDRQNEVNGEPRGNAPDYAISYVAEARRQNGARFDIRGETKPFGQYSLFLGRDTTLLSVEFYDRKTNSYGIVFPHVQPGTPYALPRAYLGPIDASFGDLDADGLADVAERVLGTSYYESDTDGDGISDSAEIEQGLDPLDDRGFPTGIIASLPLLGEAKEVVVEGSTLDATRQTAYVATGSHGLAIVDSSRFNQPIILGQLDLPGDAVDVAIDARLQIAAVASSTGGLHLVDVSDPMIPRVPPGRTINISANQVEVFDGVAYVGVGSELRAYDLLTGDRLQALPPGGGAITGLARERSMLYSMDNTRFVRAIDISGPAMTMRGSPLQLPQGGGKIFVGDNILYAGAQTSYTPGGFVTVDVSDPNILTLVSASDISGDFIAPGLAIAPNGSGLGIAIGMVGAQANRPVVGVADVSEPQNTADYLTQFDLPARPVGVTLASGIGFVAAGLAGLVVVNYLSFDNRGEAPTITIDASPVDADLLLPGTKVEEGRAIPIRAVVLDDVQVRNVELLVNGQVVANDLSFPFDLVGIVPAIAPDSATMTIQVRATDTGGNLALSNVLVYDIVADETPPEIENLAPTDGGNVSRSFRRVQIAFSESIDATTATAASFTLLDSTSNTIFPIDVRLRSNDQLIQLTYPTLALGTYQFVINATAVRDRAGNALGTLPTVINFNVTPYSIGWTNSAGGNWHDPANWDRGDIPGPEDDVLIDVPGEVLVTYTGTETAITSLVSQEAFSITGGTLHVDSTIQVNNTFTLNSVSSSNPARIVGGRILSPVIIGGTVPARLENVAIDGALDLATNRFATVLVAGNFVLNGVATMGRDSQLKFNDSAGSTQMLNGTGTVIFSLATGPGQTPFIITNPTSTLIIGPDVTLHGGPGLIGIAPNAIGRVNLINHGTIRADVPGTTMYVVGQDLENDGLIEAATNTILFAGGGVRFVNRGIIRANGGRMDLRPLENEGTVIARGAGGRVDLAFPLPNEGRIATENGGVVVVSDRPFVQEQSGTLAVELGVGGTSVFVNQTATLGGTLDVTTAAGFVPSVGQMFTPLTYASATGQFATIDGHGIEYTPTYGATGLTLTVAGAGVGGQGSGVREEGRSPIPARRSERSTLPPSTLHPISPSVSSVSSVVKLRATRRIRLAVPAIDHALAEWG